MTNESINLNSPDYHNPIGHWIYRIRSRVPHITSGAKMIFSFILAFFVIRSLLRASVRKDLEARINGLDHDVINYILAGNEISSELWYKIDVTKADLAKRWLNYN